MKKKNTPIEKKMSSSSLKRRCDIIMDGSDDYDHIDLFSLEEKCVKKRELFRKLCSSEQFLWAKRPSEMSFCTLNQLIPDQVSKEKLFLSIVRSFDFQDRYINMVTNFAQRTPPWYLTKEGWISMSLNIIRPYMLSSSNVGDQLGHKKKYDGPQKEILNKDGSESKFMFHILTQRGTASEPFTRENFKLIASQFYGENVIMNVDEEGMKIDKKRPYTSASPDGILKMVDTNAENISEMYLTSGMEMKCIGMEGKPPYGYIPHQYYDQITHTMNVFGFKDYWFICHSSESFEVEYYKYNHSYWENQISIYEEWYWKNYWPTVYLLHCGYFFDLFKKSGMKIEQVNVFLRAHPFVAKLFSSLNVDFSSYIVEKQEANAVTACHQHDEENRSLFDEIDAKIDDYLFSIIECENNNTDNSSGKSEVKIGTLDTSIFEILHDVMPLLVKERNNFDAGLIMKFCFENDLEDFISNLYFMTS